MIRYLRSQCTTTLAFAYLTTVAYICHISILSGIIVENTQVLCSGLISKWQWNSWMKNWSRNFDNIILLKYNKISTKEGREFAANLSILTRISGYIGVAYKTVEKINRTRFDGIVKEEWIKNFRSSSRTDPVSYPQWLFYKRILRHSVHSSYSSIYSSFSTFILVLVSVSKNT